LPAKLTLTPAFRTIWLHLDILLESDISLSQFLKP
jgi:hypothetical protein